MDLKNDIVLLECRFFQNLLTSYFYSIGDRELKEQMTNGTCNMLSNKMGNPGNQTMSIANFKKIIELNNQNLLIGGLKKKTLKKK